MSKTRTRPSRIQKPKEPDLDVLITKEQVANIQRLQAQINDAQNRQGLYIQAILDSVGHDGDMKVAGPVKRGNKFYLEVTKITNPKKNGEV